MPSVPAIDPLELDQLRAEPQRFTVVRRCL